MILTELSTDKLIEGQRRLDKPKVWRLSNKGRKLHGITKKPVALRSLKIDHYLAIADVLLQLREQGKLTAFDTEPREKFEILGRRRKYCPDAYFILNGRAYLLEVQIKRLSSDQWADKWAGAQAALRRVRWEQDPQKIVVVTKQQRKTVGGYSLPLLVVPTIEEFAKWEAWARL